MAWTSENWSQDDSKNFGFPFSAEPAPKADFSNSKTVWKLSDENFGFPFVTSAGLAGKADFSKSKSVWKLHPAVNFGFPYIVTTEKIPAGKPVFSAFSVSGMGAGFHQQNQKIPLHFTDTAAFQFKMPDALHFYFPDMKEVSL